MSLKLHLSILFLYSIILSIDFSIIDFYDANQQYDLEFQEIQKLSNKSDPELIWRISRAYFNQAEKENNLEQKNKLFYISYDYSKQALHLDSMIAKANHYYAVLHGQIGLIEGTKQKIINAYDVLKYGKIAIDLDPSYDNTYHLLGRLNFELANLSWFERNIASLIYETPPAGSFEMAVDYFLTAIKLNPNDTRHWLWLSKSYIALDQHDKAKPSLLKTISLIPKDQKDKNNIEEANKILLNNY